jgi:membrane peptidoglycan carboxypeptidase
MALYHPPSPADPHIQPKAPLWKRSRPLRIAQQMRRRRDRWSRNSPARKIAIGLLISCMLLLIIFLSSGGIYAYTFYENQLPRLQQIANLRISQTSRIYDRNNVLLSEEYDKGANSGRRTPVSYQEIPKVMQDAMIAAEDPSFWTNPGIDPQGIIRAATGYLSSGGSIQGGGSTITQQVIKNMTGDDEQSLNRKMAEAALAIGLTQQYPKWKVLEMYFNVAGFATLDLGVESATQELFKLSPQCQKANLQCTPAIAQLNYNQATKQNDPLLGLARASLLAGMPQNPVSYDPTRGPNFKKRALARQGYVLEQMIRWNMSVEGLGPITPEIVTKVTALTEQMQFTQYHSSKQAPHFVDWIRDQVAFILGNGNKEKGYQAFVTGGFNIRTTLDLNLEQYVENAVKRHITELEYQPFRYVTVKLNEHNNLNTAAVVVMNAKTGEILAMNGSLDYGQTDIKVGGQWNMAVDPRQPGSTFKPIVYATTFQMGWYPGIILPDFETFFPNGGFAGMSNKDTYHPTDYGNTYNRQFSTIRMATANSFNVPAVKALSFAGVDHVLNTARRMGITDLDASIARLKKNKQCAPQARASECIRLSLALGTVEISPLQMAGAYQVFANQGSHVPAQGILDIWDNYGNHLYHYDPNRAPTTRVFSPQVAYMMTSVLTDEEARAFEFGNVHELSFWDWDSKCSTLSWRIQAGIPRCVHDVAAKTGTTDNFKDNWTLGYTPNVVVGVWAGNKNGEAMTNNPTGITGAAPIWHDVIAYASGRPCAQIDAKIVCPAQPLDRKSLNLIQPDRFMQPNGLQIISTSAGNGLMGSGSPDFMLVNQQPQQTGYHVSDTNCDFNNYNNTNSNGCSNTNGDNKDNQDNNKEKK